MDYLKEVLKRSPNSPLIKSPFLRIKVEFKKLSSKIDDIDFLNTFTRIKLGKQEKITKIIRHVSSPRWLDEYEFQVDNNKDDTVLIEIYSTKLYSTTDAKIIGFQSIPIKILEKNNMVGEKISLILRLILTSPTEFFSEDENNILHIGKHDPLKYRINAKDANQINENIKTTLSPLLYVTFEYMNFYHLWKCNINIHSIVQRNDIKNNNYYFYKLFIKRNDGLQWFKEVTFEEIIQFRNFLMNYVEEVLFLD